ncbi:hypothetical protein B4U80_14652 [Leptotrombidium deliense]|uniref:C-type lectin domain-containing protein n=1 Tax=Leptotrombidium deliense TaxID=299467 RepID=A0A443RSW4_9ACAR|nr:hypothetical protein B4U80_14652 [Leptotrombidium deliense]
MHNKVNHKNVYFWLGGRTVFVRESQFEWPDGTPIDFANLIKEKPNKFDLHYGACINMFTDVGYWHDYFCVVYPHMRELCAKKIDAKY